MPTIDLGITEEDQTLPLALQDLSPNASTCIDKPTHLTDFLLSFKVNRIFFSEQERHIDMDSKITNKDFCFHLNHSKFSFLYQAFWQ